MGQAALGLASGWLASNWGAIAEAQASAGRAAAGQPSEFGFLSAEQAAELDAVSSQIIPTDETPGAHEACCVHFIDRALTSFLRDSQALYREGLAQLRAAAQAQFGEARGFAALSAPQQLRLLQQIEQQPFFAAVRMHTIIAMLASPVHGGNAEQCGWRLIGFDDALHFAAPFGYYDGPVDAGR
jgi:gluconate 2-dehydrogenase gamma chain